MSIEEQLVENLHHLPPEKQQELLAFAESLVQEVEAKKDMRELERSAKLSELLQDSEIVGMWSDRREMENSVEWVRQLRRQQWRDGQGYDSAR
ncbi:DUF2281 domain-containing protein [Pseudanabaenaceae cyanobacterium LEGE 13415]|nr:DUF2281 domain-containing protein [Pseudanabaenaceae cyanobacterium LEGE 13415]